MIYKQYSVVTIAELNREFSPLDSSVGDRLPQIGDEATIVEVYSEPTLGYELECVDKNGDTHWLVTFAPKDALFELRHEPT